MSRRRTNFGPFGTLHRHRQQKVSVTPACPFELSAQVGIGGTEKGQLKGDGPSEEVAAKIRLDGADPIQLSTQKIDEGAKTRAVVQGNPLRMNEVVGQRLRRVGGPVELVLYGHDEHREC